MTRKTQKKDGKNLVIVESPAKAKTIEGYLGKEFQVESCYGHVRDLPKKNAIDIENGFQPTYEITSEKKDVIRNLKKLAKNAPIIYLASDDDREGEAISWHLKESLKLKDDETQRIVFREITKNAILKAIEAPRHIDQNLVNAQQARRILDRLVGFELSPVLWKKVKTGLSAGRVQSVAVRIVVEREREIEQFKPASSFKVTAFFQVGTKELKAELNKKFASEAEIEAFLQACTSAEYSITQLQKRDGKKSPSAPFTTSTLQQEASRRLGYSVAQTMRLAQKLYEAGKITYMRTDSVNLSQEALNNAAAEIKGSYGEQYAKRRTFKTKSNAAQEAHEAIRPTNFSQHTITGDRSEKALYEMIWKRAIASQMSDAILERTTAHIGISTQENLHFKAQGEVVKFDGFLKVYLATREDGDDEVNNKLLPPMDMGQVLPLIEMNAREVFTKPPARYTEATLVRHLEELGIGRPSTYAPTISTIQRREYVIKESREGKERQYKAYQLKDSSVQPSVQTETFGNEKNKLFPTSLAKIVNDFLVEHFENVIDYSFTAKVEEEFDGIAQGKKAWNDMIAQFYFEDFHPRVEKTADLERVGGRELGEDPKTGKKVIARLARFGPVVQIGDSEDEDKPRYASLEPHQFIDTITLEEALELFKLPRDLGQFEDLPLSIGKGRFGPYVKHGDKFVSIPKGEDPLGVSAERAIELVLEKREADAKKLIKAFDANPDIQILNGRWGAYIKFQKRNVKIPKELKEKAADLTLEEVLKIIEETPEKPKKGKAAAKTTKKATATKKKAATKTTAKKKAPAKKTAAKTTKKSTATKKKA